MKFERSGKVEMAMMVMITIITMFYGRRRDSSGNAFLM